MSKTPAETKPASENDGKMKRKPYEKELGKLQVELCQLQDWLKAEGRPGHRHIRRPRRGRQRRHHQGDHRTRQPARLSGGRACRRRPIAKRRRCFFSATSSIFRPPAKSSSSIAVGTTAPASKMSWDSSTSGGEAISATSARRSSRYILDAGIILIKFWLEVGQEEQERRFLARINDPVRQWKLSPMDLELFRRWYDYSHARDVMLKATDTDYAPWHIVRSDDKKRARLNCISALLELIPYKKIKQIKVKLPKRSNKGHYDDQASMRGRNFVAERF